jgi:hypothetical protein
MAQSPKRPPVEVLKVGVGSGGAPSKNAMPLSMTVSSGSCRNGSMSQVEERQSLDG